jgi:hypothetical protein
MSAQVSLSGVKPTSGKWAKIDVIDPMYGPAVRRKRISSSWR